MSTKNPSNSWPDWLSQLRKTKIVTPIVEDPRTKQRPGTILGHTKNEILREAIGWGQADFSEAWRDLSPADRALCYAFFNQSGHIDELLNAFHQLFHSHDFELPPILIDIGCGPFTSGLAFTSALPGVKCFKYIGIDRALSMTELGETLALEASRHVECERFWAKNIKELAWPYGASYQEVIVIASYLLSSPTVNINEVVSDLTMLINKISLGSSCVLYTNSAKPYPNRKLPALAEALSLNGFNNVVNENGRINRGTHSAGQERELRYALYVRQERDTLPLATD
jgi:hypothetical protein